jgi:hypothetical protein
MPGTRTRALPSLAVLLLWVFAGLAQAGPLAGSVVGIAGQVSVDRSGQRYALRLSDPVYVDDTFTVPGGAKLKLRMNDGSVLSLAPGTSLRIDAYALDASGRRLSVGQGLVRAATAPAGGPSNFEIDTAVGTSGARSTDWFVEAAPSSEQVAVLSGSVSLTSRATGRGVLIPPGFGSRVDAGRDPTPPRPVSQAEFGALIARTEGAGAPPGPAYPPPAYYPPGRGTQLPLPGGERGGRPSPPPSRGGQPGGGREGNPPR